MAALPLHQSTFEQNPKPKLRVVARRRPKPFESLLSRSLIFSALAFTAFLASSLAGNVMLEKARQEGKSAFRRNLAAREYRATLQRQVISLAGVNAIGAWAKANGFVPPDSTLRTSSENSRVAFNR